MLDPELAGEHALELAPASVASRRPGRRARARRRLQKDPAGVAQEAVGRPGMIRHGQGGDPIGPRVAGQEDDQSGHRGPDEGQQVGESCW